MKSAVAAVTIFAAAVILGVLWVEVSARREMRELEGWWSDRARRRG